MPEHPVVVQRSVSLVECPVLNPFSVETGSDNLHHSHVERPEFPKPSTLW